MAHAGWDGVGAVPRRRRSGPGVAGRMARSALLVQVVLATVLLSSASAQVFSVALDVTIGGPPQVAVGQTGLPGQLTIANGSSGVGPVTLTQIVYNPSCGDFSLSCGSPDLGVFSLSPTATGTGGACSGRTFTVGGPDANGRFTFTPQSPVVLQPPGSANSDCVIAFTFDVLRMPTIDSLPGTPGMQTTRFAMVAGTAQAGGGVTVNGTATAIATVTVTPPPSGTFHPLTPTRILDTRDGTGGLSGPLGPGSTASVAVAGRGGVPATGVGAVALNVTVTQPSAEGYLSLYPTGEPRPLAANLNFTPAKTVPNLVVVKLGSGGSVDVFNPAGTTHVVYDVAGWFSTDPTAPDGRFTALSPARILDTRDGTGGSSLRLGPGASLDLQVGGRGGVPATGAAAVALNVAVTSTTAPSFLTVFPTGTPRPLAANLNWVAADTVSNRVLARLGPGGRISLYNSAGQADVVVDVGGWFADASAPVSAGGAYVALSPARILDTRTGAGGVTGPLAPAATVDVVATGRGGIPAAGVTAVVLNVTVVGPAGAGYLTAFPSATPRPLASDLNYAPGETRPNLVVVKVGAGGKVALFTLAGTHVVVDVAGYFT
jgi:hypothetical protein